MQQSMDREAFLQRLSMLSFAAVAGCAGGVPAAIQATGSDGAALLPPGMTKHVDSAGNTTYTAGSGSMTIATSGSTVTMTSYLNGVQQGTVSATLSGNDLLFTGSNIAPYTLDVTNAAGASSLTVPGLGTVTPVSSAQASISGPAIPSGTLAAGSYFDGTITTSATYEGVSQSSSQTLGGGGGVCHSGCPQVGVAIGGSRHADGVPPWVGWAVAGIGFVLALIGMALAIAFGSVAAAVIAVLAAIAALIALILEAL
jgi:hypothetical protein